jgi:hypothetical protein
MSKFDDQDAQPLSEHQVEQYMTAFHAGLHLMDTDPAEASRIGRLASKTDAQILSGTPAASDDSWPCQDLATLLAQPQNERRLPPRPRRRHGGRPKRSRNVRIRHQARIAPEKMPVLKVIAAVSGLLILMVAPLPEVLDGAALAILLFSVVITWLLVFPAVRSHEPSRRKAAYEVLGLILKFLRRYR